MSTEATTTTGDNPYAGFVMHLADCTNTLLREIADKSMKRKDIASTYGLSIHAERYGEKVDWSAVNKAIIERWSVFGLNWIKKEAWKRCERIN